jgi:hypothetical protein
MTTPIERDEYDLWAESSEETTRKANECNRLTMLGNLDKWIDDAFSFIDQEMQGLEVQEDD